MKNEVIIQSFQGDTLTILEGKALDVKAPLPVVFSGDINSVYNFLSKRHGASFEERDAIQVTAGSQFPDITRAIIVADKENMAIALFIDPEYPYGGQIIGQLKFNPDLQNFSINTSKMFNKEELVKLLRFNKRFFPDKERHMNVLNSFQNMKLSASTQIEQNNDTRGNKKALFDKQVDTSNIPDGFVLKIPIFYGQKNETFRVDIGVEQTDGAVRFWLESTELAELIEERKDEIFAFQLGRFGEFVVIYK